ncbi:hypothetical protein ALQ56_200261 [Pseudomonas syringae pv. papulans]|nr:hypothetical protein ALQ56_200261 [Pseudomonas syringae pv. papulans]
MDEPILIRPSGVAAGHAWSRRTFMAAKPNSARKSAIDALSAKSPALTSTWSVVERPISSRNSPKISAPMHAIESFIRHSVPFAGRKLSSANFELSFLVS